MAEWSQLPADLLYLVSKCLTSDIDILRFRSVCSTWRSSVPLSFDPYGFPFLPNTGFSSYQWGFYLRRRTIYYVGLPQSHSQTTSTTNKDGWIIKLEGGEPDRKHLLNPLTPDKFEPLPENFPKILDFWNLQIRELGKEYVLKSMTFSPFASSVRDARDLYMEKIAVCFNDVGDFKLLTIFISGKLVLYTSGHSKWTVINCTAFPVDDVIFYDGNFYATDHKGTTVIVKLNSESIPTVSEVALPVHGGDKKFLVESCGDLLLVDLYFSGGPVDGLRYSEELEFYEQFDYFMREMALKFKVFRLDRNGKIWTEVNTLGDRMLFLGDNSTFSASASDFPSLGKGNCIYFTGPLFIHGDEAVDYENRETCVFDLGTGSVLPIYSHGYTEMFWPPPKWLHPTSTMEVKDSLDGLVQRNLETFQDELIGNLAN